ncbi:hrpB, partial [Symbiodinium sp. CCMP2456]
MLEGGHVDGKVIVLQPRRITALSVAKRMADLWGEPVGETVGYRIRHESVVSNRTRIEVVTEGVLVRILNGNPTLEGISCIFFDEFHERSVDSDLSFTLCLHLKRQRRVPVRMVVMSATFGALGEKVSKLLQNSRQIISEGRAYPVAVNYCGVLNLRNWEPRGPRDFANTVAKQIQLALDEHEGDVLVFVPGEREIMYVWIALNNMGIGDGQRPKNLVPWAHRLIDDSKLDLSKKIQVSPLYGTMETHEQDAVITDSGDGWRKVILATSIAESSITVPTVRIVVDTGLRRVKAVDPTTSLSEMR